MKKICSSVERGFASEISCIDFTFPKFEAVERLCVTLSIKRGCQPPHISGKVLLGIELPSGAKRQSEMGQRLEGKIVRDKFRSVREFNSVTIK